MSVDEAALPCRLGHFKAGGPKQPEAMTLHSTASCLDCPGNSGSQLPQALSPRIPSLTQAIPSLCYRVKPPCRQTYMEMV